MTPLHSFIYDDVALLAKTHHANQKSLEDSNALKIAQQESAQLIKGQ
jgi:hypothetical protein